MPIKAKSREAAGAWSAERFDDPEPRCGWCDQRCGCYAVDIFCSTACWEKWRQYEDENPTGWCPGCGRYGRYGSSCFRMLDGQMEECGQFV